MKSPNLRKDAWILASQKAHKPFRQAEISHSGSFKPSYLREPAESNRTENPNLIKKVKDIGKPPQISDGLLRNDLRDKWLRRSQ